MATATASTAGEEDAATTLSLFMEQVGTDWKSPKARAAALSAARATVVVPNPAVRRFAQDAADAKSPYDALPRDAKGKVQPDARLRYADYAYAWLVMARIALPTDDDGDACYHVYGFSTAPTAAQVTDLKFFRTLNAREMASFHRPKLVRTDFFTADAAALAPVRMQTASGTAFDFAPADPRYILAAAVPRARGSRTLGRKAAADDDNDDEEEEAKEEEVAHVEEVTTAPAVQRPRKARPPAKDKKESVLVHRRAREAAARALLELVPNIVFRSNTPEFAALQALLPTGTLTLTLGARECFNPFPFDMNIEVFTLRNLFHALLSPFAAVPQQQTWATLPLVQLALVSGNPEGFMRHSVADYLARTRVPLRETNIYALHDEWSNTKLPSYQRKLDQAVIMFAATLTSSLRAADSAVLEHCGPLFALAAAAEKVGALEYMRLPQAAADAVSLRCALTGKALVGGEDVLLVKAKMRDDPAVEACAFVTCEVPWAVCPLRRAAVPETAPTLDVPPKTKKPATARPQTKLLVQDALESVTTALSLAMPRKKPAKEPEPEAEPEAPVPAPVPVPVPVPAAEAAVKKPKKLKRPASESADAEAPPPAKKAKRASVPKAKAEAEAGVDSVPASAPLHAKFRALGAWPGAAHDKTRAAVAKYFASVTTPETAAVWATEMKMRGQLIAQLAKSVVRLFFVAGAPGAAAAAVAKDDSEEEEAAALMGLIAGAGTGTGAPARAPVYQAPAHVGPCVRFLVAQIEADADAAADDLLAARLLAAKDKEEESIVATMAACYALPADSEHVQSIAKFCGIIYATLFPGNDKKA